MVRRFAEEKFAAWILSEMVRSKTRVQELKERYPSAPVSEHAQRLIDEKKKWAGTGGAVSGLFGLITLPADLALVAYLQLSLIIDLAVLCGKNLKSARARDEVLDIFAAANDANGTAARASPKAVARLAERLLSKKGLRVMGRFFPILAAPLSAALNNRDIQLVGEQAMKYYSAIPRALGDKRALR